VVQPPVYTSPIDTIAQIPKYIAPAITTMDLSPLIYIFIALIFLVIVGVGIYAYKKMSVAHQSP
jgi:TRAP-type C4-dicarboxylate transport system permease large subunit